VSLFRLQAVTSRLRAVDWAQVLGARVADTPYKRHRQRQATLKRSAVNIRRSVKLKLNHQLSSLSDSRQILDIELRLIKRLLELLLLTLLTGMIFLRCFALCS